MVSFPRASFLSIRYRVPAWEKKIRPDFDCLIFLMFSCAHLRVFYFSFFILLITYLPVYVIPAFSLRSFLTLE